MINFENAIRMDKIATMSASELAQIQDLLTPKATKTALQQVKDMLKDGVSMYDMPVHILMDAIELKMNSVGYHHHAIRTTYYDLFIIAEQLTDYYEHHVHDMLKAQIAATLFSIDYNCYYDDGDDE